MQMGQLQTEDSYPHHVQFQWWMVDITTHTNLQFPATVLFSDKASQLYKTRYFQQASFAREGIFSTQTQ